MIVCVGIWLGGEEWVEFSCRAALLVFVFIGQLVGGKKKGGSRNWASCEGAERLQGKSGEEREGHEGSVKLRPS